MNDCHPLASQYYNIIKDIIVNDKVRSMKQFIQHGEVDCFDHSLQVSWISYRICKKLKLNFRAAARAGFLHDFFLYDWHIKDSTRRWHAFRHPYIARDNAKRYFTMSKLEEKIIIRHMWPLTPIPPLCPEAFIVSMVDKYCSILESLRIAPKQLAFIEIEKTQE